MPSTFRRVALRTALGAVLGALAGAVALVVADQITPGFSLDMDRGTAGVVRGLYPAERAGQETFTWTRQDVTMDLPGLDRHRAWSCTIRLRGARPDPATVPDVTVTIDGVAVARHRISNEYQDLTIDVPVRPRNAGVVLTLSASSTFQPSTSDTRALGMLIDRWSCAPQATGLLRPPAGALIGAALGAALFGAALALIGLSPLAWIAAIGVLAVAQTALLTRDLAPFAPYAARLPWMAAWLAALMILVTRLLEWRLGARLHPAARYVVIFTAAVLYLKLAALMHPSKLLADAVFHAHRLEWVLGGRLLFVQPLASGLNFPYAPGLYVVAAPWSWLVHDYVGLLRTVVASAEACGGALLYLVIVRAWGDRLAGAMAVTLFHAVPLTYARMGDANLTNLFAQDVSLLTMCAVALWPLQRSHRGQVVALGLLAALAFLSHVSTFALLFATLLAAAGLFRAFGGPSLRVPARSVALAAIVAAAMAVVIYYARFDEVYERLGAITGLAGDTTSGGDVVPSAGIAGAPQGRAVAPTPRLARSVAALDLTATVIGWPILALAAIGLWAVRRSDLQVRQNPEGGPEGPPHAQNAQRLALVLSAWGVAYVTFLAIGALAPVDPGNERYAAEFINRVALATYPAAIVLAARGVVWAWRAGRVPAAVALSLAAIAVWFGVRHWLDWLR